MSISKHQIIKRRLSLTGGVAFAATLASLFLVNSVFAADGGKAAVEEETMIDLLKKGGLLMYPLGIASILALAIAVERFISLQRERVLPPEFLHKLNEAWEKDPSGKAAAECCEEEGGSAGHIFRAGLRWRSAGYEAVWKAMAEAGSREADRMKRSLRGLSLVARISPTMGLLGTVYGMIAAFQETSRSAGAAKPEQLANGIYEALVTTAAGLTIAIPVILLYQFLVARVDSLMDYVDEAGTEFLIAHAEEEGVLSQLADSLTVDGDVNTQGEAA